LATAQTLPAVELKPRTRSPWRRFALVWRSPVGLVGGGIVLIVIFCALAAPWLAPHDPALISIPTRLVPPVWYEGGNPEYLFGTDQLGRDLLSRLIYGSRVSVIVGVLGVVVSLIIGVTLGLISGYAGGFVDALISRTLDTFMSVPFILLAMAVVGVLGPRQGGGMWTLIVVLGVTGWVNFARVVRGEVLSVKQREYIEAARSIGQNGPLILLRHILPNVTASIIVLGTLQVATVIIAESSLSFMGLGVQPPTITWGSMLADSRDHLATSWWLATFPGVAISITVLGTILLGDWLRDVLDPRQTK
jgi:peptide/nickel transport system permease protein